MPPMTLPENPPNRFRAHAQGLDGPPSLSGPPATAGIFQQLIDEWARLCTLPSLTRTLQRWTDAEPALSGSSSLGGLIDHIDDAGEDEKDRLLLALIRLTQDGHQLAGRVVLQAMLPKIARIVRGLRSSPNDQTIEDRRHLGVATMWEVIHAYPAGRRQSRVAANLALDTLHRLTDNLRKPEADVPMDPEEISGHLARGRRAGAVHSDAERQSGTGSSCEGISSDAELLEVISWAVEIGAIVPDEGSLLVRVYLPEPGREGSATVAADLGLSPAALRQRCSRARRRLIAAVRADAEGGQRPVRRRTAA